jgi:hypothetical protein
VSLRALESNIKLTKQSHLLASITFSARSASERFLLCMRSYMAQEVFCSVKFSVAICTLLRRHLAERGYRECEFGNQSLRRNEGERSALRVKKASCLW